MSVEEHRHEMRREAARYERLTSKIRMGLVDSVDTAQHAVKVRLQPENIVTGYLPVGSLLVGNGWGLHALPKVGTQVVVAFQEGDGEAGVVLVSIFGQVRKPPAEVPVGAVWLVSEAGAQVRLNEDGSVDIWAAVLRIGAASASFLRLVTYAFKAFFDNHTHPGSNQPPSQKMGDEHFTTNLTAS